MGDVARAVPLARAPRSLHSLCEATRKITKGAAASGLTAQSGAWWTTPPTSCCTAHYTWRIASACSTEYVQPCSRSGSHWVT